MDIQEEYHSDEESQKKKMDAAREKEKQAEEEAVRRRNLFVKGASVVDSITTSVTLMCNCRGQDREGGENR